MSLVDLTIEDDGWNALPLTEISETAARAALAAQNLDPADFEISLLACSDDRIARLNASFRGKPSPTNVLSWPSEALTPDQPGATPPPPSHAAPTGQTPLGDVAIALQTCEREAREHSIDLKNHVTHLILHGCLHLLGFDHETDEDAALMEGIEIQALAELGIETPYS
ncbi:MAG: rRNA maturation RNase YbeY [Pseudomonadota bacterium]